VPRRSVSSVSVVIPCYPLWGRPAPMVPPPTSMQAARELAGSVWVPSWTGSVRVTRWRYISSGCSTVSHTTFHDSPRGRIDPGRPHPGRRGARDIRVYIQGTQLPRPLPRAFELSRDSMPSCARLPANRTILHASEGAWGHPGTPRGPAHGGACPPRRAAAQPPPPRFPPLRGASHLPIFRCQLANALGLLGPPPRARRPGPRVPSEPNPPRRDRFPRAHHASHQRPIEPPGQGPRAHAESPAVKRPPSRPTTLPLRCTTIDSASAHRAPAQSLPPCHAMPSTTSTVEETTPIQTHRPWLAPKRARKRSAVPTRFPGARPHTQCGPPPASRPSPPLPSLAANWRG
jgi:hypothetical protein